jgi:hypothetical protein
VGGWHAHPEQTHEPVLIGLLTSSPLEGIPQHSCNILVGALWQEGNLDLFWGFVLILTAGM